MIRILVHPWFTRTSLHHYVIIRSYNYIRQTRVYIYVFFNLYI